MKRRTLDTRREAKASATRDPSAPAVGALSVIVKVSRSGYVPEGLRLRARLGPQIFTAELDPDDLERVEADPLVVSLTTAQRLRST